MYRVGGSGFLGGGFGLGLSQPAQHSQASAEEKKLSLLESFAAQVKKTYKTVSTTTCTILTLASTGIPMRDFAGLVVAVELTHQEKAQRPTFQALRPGSRQEPGGLSFSLFSAFFLFMLVLLLLLVSHCYSSYSCYSYVC